MERRLKELHLTCRSGRNVLELGDGTFLTGFWLVKPEHIYEGVIVALHETKTAQSYCQGVVIGLNNIRYEKTKSGRSQRRIQIHARTTPVSLKWKGNSAGEKGLVWG